jgi:hypothetical protein
MQLNLNLAFVSVFAVVLGLAIETTRAADKKPRHHLGSRRIVE